jgi:hypothetical protein
VTGSTGPTGATGPASQVLGGGIATEGLLGLNHFMGMFVSGSSATEAHVQQPMPVAGTLKDFYIRIDSALSALNSETYTVRRNAVDTTLTCTITNGSGAVTCSDTTHSVSFSAGDLISIGTSHGGAVPSQGTRWTAHYQ